MKRTPKSKKANPPQGRSFRPRPAPLRRGAGLAASLLFLCGARPALAQINDPQPPRWLNLRPITAYTGIQVESEMQTERTAQNDKITTDRFYLAPTVGADLGGSIYHPNLLRFDLSGQGGYVEQTLSSHDASGTTTKSTDTSFLQNYNASIQLLQSKPYGSDFWITRDHSYQSLDIFNQVTVDRQSYGGHLGYNQGPVPVNFTFKHTEEDQSGLQYDSTYKQDNLAVSANSERKGAGSTFFTYNLGQYTQSAANLFSTSDTYQYGSLTDTEEFGRDKRFKLSSYAYFNQDNSTNNDQTTFSLQEHLTVQHTPNVTTFYNYNFNDNTEGAADSTAHYLTAGVRHQLFESLSSEFNVHGSVMDSGAPGSSSSANIFGVGNSESYNKRLGDWGRLTIGNSVSLDLEHENNAGSVTPVFNEQHTLTDATPTFLNQPLVISVTQVTDPTGSHIYIPGIDYSAFASGQLEQIERLPTSHDLTNGASVLVTYTVATQPSGSISTLNDQLQIRLDLFEGLLGFYTGLGWLENHSAEAFVLDNEVTTLSGADLSWRWLRTGASYETHNSSLVSYDAYNLYQTAAFQPDDTGTINLNARERWTRYPDTHEAVTDYIFTARLSQRLNRALNLSVEAGVLEEQGGFQPQTLFSARTDLNYSLGKLFVALGYQFNNLDGLGMRAQRNFVSFRLKRVF